MKGALVVGCGYTGTRLAARLLRMGFRVVGTTRSEERAGELEAAGIEPLIGELNDRETLRRIERLGLALVAYFVPPQDEGDPLPQVLAAAAAAPLEAFLYASSTSVYGDRGGDWVDETTMVKPETLEAEARHAAERIIVGAARSDQAPTRVCRITGIYGPGRTLRRALESGDYVLVKDHDTWVNRIHVDDLVSGLIAAWLRGGDGRVYNLVDDQPHRASEFANLAADLHVLPRPEWIGLSDAVERFGDARLGRKLSNKRVRSLLLKEDLGLDLKYPSYRVGLPAAVEEEKG
ncbi:MAG: NAD-dependent epimerase/dehydratase family protein [Gemmatimonadota bacterium]|nr:MAG: NAD-dependent epimerase/dehydratase family protein [Gemmatimonadota bacterium]